MAMSANDRRTKILAAFWQCKNRYQLIYNTKIAWWCYLFYFLLQICVWKGIEEEADHVGSETPATSISANCFIPANYSNTATMERGTTRVIPISYRVRIKYLKKNRLRKY